MFIFEKLTFRIVPNHYLSECLILEIILNKKARNKSKIKHLNDG